MILKKTHNETNRLMSFHVNTTAVSYVWVKRSFITDGVICVCASNIGAIRGIYNQSVFKLNKNEYLVKDNYGFQSIVTREMFFTD
jgi:hypothetical protein